MSLGLGFLFTARDQASGSIRKLSGNFNQLGGNATKGGKLAKGAMVGLGASAVVAGVGIGGLVAGVKSAGAFGEFQQGIANVGATMSATDKEMEKLSKRAIQAGIDTQFSPVEATEGLDALAAAGQNTEQSISSLGGVLDLAAGSKGQLGLAESAEAVVGTLNSYGLAADQAGNVTDKLLKATQKSNFQARDFSVGLAKAAASGAQFDQKLETVLVTMGFLRNANIDASSSATAFREATTRLAADSKAQQAVTKKGVKIFDEQTGKMRQLPDIMLDLSKATADLGTKERSAIAVRAFGKRGLLAFNAVAKGTFTTMQDGKKVTLTGKAAFDAFSSSLANAGGTAEETRKRLLDTFEGQKTLLAGTLQTLAITSGEAFSEIFRPIVTAVTSFLNIIIKAIVATPKPIKKIIGGLFLAVSGFVAMAGATGILTAGIMLMLPVIKVAAVAMGLLLLAMLPVIAGFALAALAVVGFRQAFDKNVGGIADSASNTFGKIKLAAQALFQFFSEGKISGAVAEDLAKAGNEGVFNFVNTIAQTVQRVVNFFRGISTGFSEAIGEMGPTFERLVAAFDKLGEALGFLGAESGADQARDKFDKFGSTGERVGKALAGIFEGIVKAITFVVDASADFIEAFGLADTELSSFKSTFDSMGQSVDLLAEAFGMTGSGADDAGGRVNTFKSMIEGAVFVLDSLLTTGAVVFNAVSNIVADFVSSARMSFELFMGQIDLIRAVFAFMSGDTERAFALVKRSIFRSIAAIVGKLAFFVSKIAAMQRQLGVKLPGFDIDAIEASLKSAKKSLESGIDEQSAIITPRRVSGPRIGAAAQTAGGDAINASFAAAETPAAAGAASRASAGVGGAAIAQTIAAAIAQVRIAAPGVNVKVLLDSDEIAGRIEQSTDDAPGGPGTGR